MSVILAGCHREEPPTSDIVAQAATTVPAGFVDELVASGLTAPTAMEFAPDGRLFVTGQYGDLRVIKNGALLSAPFVSVQTNSLGERGLLGVAFDPSFASNQYVYIYYTSPSPVLNNRITRWRASGDVAVAGSEQVVFQGDPLSSATNHNGGAIHFGGDGKLYAGVGDNANWQSSQSMNITHGKMLRLNGDGTIPTDNPFYGTATGKNRAIWALGLRNPFTFAVQPGTGKMYINDVGEWTWEEVDLGVAGGNYGWSTTEGPTSDPRFITPAYAYHHNTGACAIVGGTFYNPPVVQFPSTYVGKYFFSESCGGIFRVLDPANNSVTEFSRGASCVDLKTGPDGALYYLARDVGAVRRIRYVGGGGQAPTISQHPASLTRGPGQSATFTVAASGTQPLAYQWQRNGSNIAGATATSYTISSVTTGDNGATFRARVSNAHGTVTSNSATLTVTSNQAPTASITTPPAGTLYSAGETISFSGNGTDPEDGTLPASAFTWSVVFHHDTHTHPFINQIAGVKNGTFVIPNDGERATNVWYRIHLSVRDAGGLVHATFRDITPRVVNLTMQTSPTGLQVLVDGATLTAPATISSVVGMLRGLSAPSPQSSGGSDYTFSAWSDGGAATHQITTPTSNTTYTATFTASAPPAAFLESGGLAVMESENSTGSAAGTAGAAGATWTLRSLAGQSGAGALEATPNAGVITNETTVGPRRDYAVRFATAGTYYLWVRMDCPNGNDDSIHVGLDGTAASLGGTGLMGPAGWSWRNMVGSARVRVTVASAGLHTVNLWMREDGVRVDKLLVTTDAAFTPAGTGPAESMRESGPPPPPPPPPPPGMRFVESAGQVVMEAENSTGAAAGSGVAASSTWTVRSLAGQSGTGALEATPNSGVITHETTVGPRRDYAVRFTTPGTYYLWVRMLGPNGFDDSAHAGMNGSVATLGGTGLIAGPGWSWQTTVNGSRVRVTVAAAGVATINLWMREDGVQVDKLLLTTSSSFTPSGTGPAESPRE